MSEPKSRLTSANEIAGIIGTLLAIATFAITLLTLGHGDANQPLTASSSQSAPSAISSSVSSSQSTPAQPSPQTQSQPALVEKAKNTGKEIGYALIIIAPIFYILLSLANLRTYIKIALTESASLALAAIFFRKLADPQVLDSNGSSQIYLVWPILSLAGLGVYRAVRYYGIRNLLPRL